MSAPVDDITIYMGTLPPDEYEQRRRLRTLRNGASHKVTRTNCADTRALCWMVNERATEWIYAPADVEALLDIVLLCKRLLTVADQLEVIEAKYHGR